jgi:hypothetical protein
LQQLLPLLLGPALANCMPAASATPLHNAAPEGPNVYFYGDASRGGKNLEGDDSEEPKPSTTVASSEPKKVGPSEPPRPKADAGDDAEDGKADEKPDEAANLPARSFADLPGRYAGTDTLKINIDGSAERVETDDGAKLTVEKVDGKPDSYVFKIVDSQSGTDLCAVTGVAKKHALEFEPGQSCLKTILGLPMTAKLESGRAKLDGKELVVDYVIELDVEGPRGSIDGQIDYHFGGTRE